MQRNAATMVAIPSLQGGGGETDALCQKITSNANSDPRLSRWGGGGGSPLAVYL